MLRQPQNTNFLRDTGNDTMHTIFEGEHAVELHTKDVEVGTSLVINLKQDQVTMGRAHSPGFTND